VQTFPPQHEKSSLVSRLVETWEKLPVHVQGEEKQSVVKKKIKSWARCGDGGGGRGGADLPRMFLPRKTFFNQNVFT
jgi:hypothetical protein